MKNYRFCGCCTSIQVLVSELAQLRSDGPNSSHVVELESRVSAAATNIRRKDEEIHQLRSRFVLLSSCCPELNLGLRYSQQS